MAGGAPLPSSSAGPHDGKNYGTALSVITTLFLMWGFITCMNDVLIPKFKEDFQLSNLQANLVQFAFFSAYFIVSLIYYLISRFGNDPIQKFGYKKAILAGLGIASIGCFLFVPAADMRSFSFCLVALFVLATGVTILQMGANPYVTLLGKPSGAEGRLNMTQAFNALGTTIAPVIGGVLVFGMFRPISVVKGPYIGLGILLILLAILIAVIKLPKVSSEPSIDENVTEGKGALKYSHLFLGVICIFMYVGGEVSIGSNIIQYLKDVIRIEEAKADSLLALYWGGAMIGRFYGAIFLSGKPVDAKKMVQIGLLVVLAFGLGVFLVNNKHIKDSVVGKGEETKELFVNQSAKDSTVTEGKVIGAEELAIISNGSELEKITGLGKYSAYKTKLYIDQEQLKTNHKLVLKDSAQNGVMVGFKYTDKKMRSFKVTWVEDVTFDASKLTFKGAIIFSVVTVLNLIMFLLGQFKSGKTLGLFSLTVILLLALTVMGVGEMSMWAVLSIGLFNSIMFPTIFSLAIKGLGVDTSQGSSLLVMAIVGGALVPLVQGALADSLGVRVGFVIPIICYVYIAFYGFVGSKPKNQAS